LISRIDTICTGLYMHESKDVKITKRREEKI
jgi:hypothetical protein